jgi:hypothetical protein
VAPAAHLNAPSCEVRLARGLNAPSGEVRLARGLNAPSGEVRLARGPPRARHPRSCSHVRAFNALTPQDCTTTLTLLGITPQRCSTDPLGKTIPTTIQHCAERPVLDPWHCATYFCTANTSSPRRGDAEPSNGGECFFYDYTGLHRDVRPAGTVFSVTISPVRPSPPLRHHVGHCDDIPDAVGAREDGTSPRPLLCLVRPPVDGTLEPAHGRWPGSQPLRHHPRNRPCMGTGLATTPHQERDSPGRSSTPWHFLPCLHT